MEKIKSENAMVIDELEYQIKDLKFKKDNLLSDLHNQQMRHHQTLNSIQKEIDILKTSTINSHTLTTKYYLKKRHYLTRHSLKTHLIQSLHTEKLIS